MTAVRIGITGPIGCGKSTVARWLAAREDVAAIDADAVARDVLAPGSHESVAVIARFGNEVRAPGDGIDRAALGRIVFSDAAALRDLEAIVHPAVRPQIVAAITAAEEGGAAAVVVEAIKLVEGGLADLCDEVWLITCDPDAQRSRIVARGSSPDDADRRIAAQGDLAVRLGPHATRVIDTSGSPDATRVAAETALDAALEAVRVRRGD